MRDAVTPVCWSSAACRVYVCGSSVPVRMLQLGVCKGIRAAGKEVILSAYGAGGLGVMMRVVGCRVASVVGQGVETRGH